MRPPSVGEGIVPVGLLGGMPLGVPIIETNGLDRNQMVLVGGCAYVAIGTSHAWVRRMRRHLARKGTRNRWGARRVPMVTR